MWEQYLPWIALIFLYGLPWLVAFLPSSWLSRGRMSRARRAVDEERHRNEYWVQRHRKRHDE